jgi:hypothetical protein
VIRLDDLLREATSGHYRNLVTRPTGAAVRDRVVDNIRGEPRTEAVLDFSRIGLIDFSCADEIVAKLLAAVHNLPVSRVVLHGISSTHADAIDHALARHGLVVLALELETGSPILLGERPDDWRSVFTALVDLGRGTATVVASHLGWPVGRASQALEGLVNAHCVLSDSNNSYSLGELA